MPKGSEELTNARKEEIIDACASLYETKSFRDITIRDIGEKTSFTRTSIYNYYHSKEEIFLALLRREHEAWTEDLNGISRQYGKLSAEEFADKLARSLEKRGCMLKLMSMNIYDMEVNSRLENLADFKKSYANALQAVTCCLERFFPSMTADNIQKFLYALFPFLFGVYPYTSHTEKQIQAMKMAHVHFISYSIYELVKPFAVRLLQSFSP
ncbi:MAG: TetR family transcriptional regulator [Candidatus Merdivicinus sp.]|jgi:AcrR family transcriptional regulator